MQPVLHLVEDRIRPTLERFAATMRRPLADVIVEAARRTTRELIAITPPASAEMTGRDAYNQGRSKIHRDMLKVLAPRTLKGKRKERHPDVAAAYRARRHFRNVGVGARVSRGALVYVDRRKFLDLHKELSGRIGRLASGWAASADSLGVAVPQWIKRHGLSRGRILQDLSGDRLRVTVTNFAPEARGNIRFEMRRRIPYALRYAAAGMQRNIDAVVLRQAGGAGIKVRRQLLAA